VEFDFSPGKQGLTKVELSLILNESAYSHYKEVLEKKYGPSRESSYTEERESWCKDLGRRLIKDQDVDSYEVGRTLNLKKAKFPFSNGWIEITLDTIPRCNEFNQSEWARKMYDLWHSQVDNVVTIQYVSRPAITSDDTKHF
jgi:hypothetical protein